MSASCWQSRVSSPLDDDVRKNVPEVPDFGAPVTLRHLLHHTSGSAPSLRCLRWRVTARATS